MALWRIGTRRSLLSLKQTSLACSFLQERLGVRTQPVPITTSGDRFLHTSLADIGGKGLFTKEIDRALQERQIDIAVHSAKDIETELPPEIAIAAFLPRAERRDCLITREPNPLSLESLPAKTRVGTCSPRRTALLQHARDDIEVLPLRGNIERRLEKLQTGEVDAVILARCALLRLDLDIPCTILDEEVFIPAAGQGAIVLSVRAGDAERLETLETLSDLSCEREVRAERAFLRALDGSCRTPLAASARMEADKARMVISGFAVPKGKGRGCWARLEGEGENTERLGELLARKISEPLHSS